MEGGQAQEGTPAPQQPGSEPHQEAVSLEEGPQRRTAQADRLFPACETRGRPAGLCPDH